MSSTYDSETNNISTAKERSAAWTEKEKARLNDISQYEIIDNNTEDTEIQDIPLLLSLICKTPMSLVTIVRDTYVTSISGVGFPLINIDKKDGFCTLAIEQDELFEITDSFLDNRVQESKFVKGTDTPIRFYASFPLKSPQGYNFGTLCVFDMKPNKLDEFQKLALITLARQVVMRFEIRKKNKILKEIIEKADRLSKAKDEFFSNISHELRTPLNAINGFANILGKSNLDENQQEAVTIIKSSSEILITLINDILDFSKMESGKLQIDKSPFNFRQAMKNIKDLLSKKAKGKDVELNFLIDDKIPITINGDKVRVNQIIMNLVGNALKFTNEGSVILNINLKEENELQYVLDFSVKDTGIGIPENKLESIFERFEQVGKEITRKYGGTGLGLSISKNLVELQNGKLNVRSVYGQGTEFYFSIAFDKLSDKELIVINPNTISSLEDLNNIRILICEDNLINIKLIKNLFKNKLAFIEVAENGKCAIEILTKNKSFDVILMDIDMPVMNGIETTKYIRNKMKLKLPIIGFSASLSKKDKELCIRIGMNDCILKSFVSDELCINISKVLQNKKYFLEDEFIKIQPKKNKYSSSINFSIKIKTEDYDIKNKQKSSKKVTLSKLKDKMNRRSYSNFKINGENIQSNQTQSTNNINNKIKTEFKFCSQEKIILNNEALVIMDIKQFDDIKKKSIEFANSSDSDSDSYEFDNKVLREISGDDQIFEIELIKIFLEESPKDMYQLETALNNKDFEKVKFVIHKMRPPISMLGDDFLIEKLINLQNKLEIENESNLKFLYVQIYSKLELKYKYLNNYLKKIEIEYSN